MAILELFLFLTKKIPSTIKFYSKQKAVLLKVCLLWEAPLIRLMSDESLQCMVFRERVSIFEVLVTQIDVFLPLGCSFWALGQLKQKKTWPEGVILTMVLPQIWPRPCIWLPVGGLYLNEWDCAMFNSWHKNVKAHW